MPANDREETTVPAPASAGMMRTLALLCAAVMLVLAMPLHAAERITIAAAADLKFAMDELVADFRASHPEDRIEVAYGSSGKFHTQIQQGAPFDLYFSADIAFPRELVALGLAASEVRLYAIGRIVIWSALEDASRLTLADLAEPRFRRIAIANPEHAPYGKRAVEALQATGIWEAVQPRLVLGENIAQTAQFVQTGNAQVGIIALSLALNPELSSRGAHALIPDNLHEPLEQGFIITRRAQGNTLARAFAAYIESPPARAIMTRYGFVLPELPAD